MIFKNLKKREGKGVLGKKGRKDRVRYEKKNSFRFQAKRPFSEKERFGRKWKEKGRFFNQKGKTEKERDRRGTFFFKPSVQPSWAVKCRYRMPFFLFDRSWVWNWGRKTEIHLLLYTGYSGPKLKKEDRLKWQTIAAMFPKNYSRKELEQYVENYERLMRSRKFPGWTRTQMKKTRESQLPRTYLIRRWYPVLLEKQLNRLWFASLESRLSRLFFSSKDQVKVKYHYIKSPWLRSSLCARYLLRRLRQRRLNFYYLIRNFLSRTNFYGGEKHNLYGIFISGAGRFTKRQRASYMKVQKGRVPFSSVSAPLDYSEVSLPLKYGACSVRVWVCHLRGQK